MANANNTSYYVYLHRKKSDGKVFYVGKGRGKRSTSKSNRNKHWKNTVAKHGYTVELYATGLQEWYALELEIELISKYGRIDNGTGCLVNWTDGGEGASGYIHSSETLEKYSLARKGKKQDAEHIKNRISKLIGTKRPKHVVDAMVRASKKRIMCSNGLVFESLTQAKEWLWSIGKTKATVSGISPCANGKQNKSYGFKWNYI